ncbi:MAG: SCP2 sterol-binding domain-containing protein [Candidatus Thorarchaeota archaeon]|jgi:putative sterol carrier protein
MTFFESKEQYIQVFEEFWSRAIAMPDVYEKLCESKIIVRFDVTQPDLTMTLDFKNEGPDGKIGTMSFEHGSEEPEIVVSSKSDVANKFWQGKLRTSIALAKGDVKLKGPITRALGLIGKIKPLEAIYIEVLKDLGLNQLLM